MSYLCSQIETSHETDIIDFIAFDPSYTGESSGEPRRTASPDINTEDFMAAVDFLSKQENVDAFKANLK